MADGSVKFDTAIDSTGIRTGLAGLGQIAMAGVAAAASALAALGTAAVKVGSDFEAQMQGIYTTSVTARTLDESPMAYKGMDAILKHIGPTVDVADIFKPLYNFKAEEAEPSFKRKK